MVVRIALEGLGLYKADMQTVADATESAASKIDKATKAAGTAAGALTGSVADAAESAQALHSAAGLAGVGLGALAVGAAAVAFAAYKGAQEQIEYQKALTLTGNAAGTTAGQMADMARAIGENVGTQYQAAQALAAMAGTGQVAGQNLQKFGQVAIEMQRSVGASVADTAKQFAELGQEPVKASLKLNESMNYLTASTFEQIKAAQELGDSENAASLAQDAYATAMKERTAEIEKNLGWISKAWLAVKDAAAWAWDAMLDIGRPNTLQSQLDTAEKAVEHYEIALRKSDGGLGTPAIQAALDAAKLVAEGLRDAVALEQLGAAAAAENAANQKAKIKWLQEGDGYLDKQAKYEQAINRTVFEGQKLLNAGQITQLEYEKRIADVRKKYSENAGKVDNSALREMEQTAALLAKLSGYSADYEKQIQLLSKARDKGTISQEVFNAEVLSLVNLQPFMVANNKALEKSLDELVKSMEDFNAAGRKADAEVYAAKTAIAEYSNATTAASAALEFETGLLGQNAAARSQAIEQYRIQAELEKKIADIKADARWGTDLVARNQAITDVQVDAAKKAAIASGRVTLDEYNKTFDRISEGLTDAIMTAGKDGGQGLRDVLEAELTKPFRVMIQAGVQPIASSLTNMVMGMPGTAGGGMLGGALGNAGSLAAMGAQFGSAASITLSNGLISGFGANMANIGGQIASGSYSAAAGMALPYLGAVIAGYSVLKNLGVFGSNFISTSSQGDSNQIFDKSGKSLTNEKSQYYQTAAMSASADKLVAAVNSSYLQAASKLGIGAAQTQFVYGSNTGEQGQNPNFRLAGGASGGVQFNTGEIALNKDALDLAANRAVLTALQSSGLPKYLQGAFDGITVGSLTQAEIDTWYTGATAIKNFHDTLAAAPWPNLQDMGYQAIQTMALFNGGIDKLGASLGTFYDAFYTADTKTANLTAQTASAFGALGITMPAADASMRDWYRTLVEGKLATDQTIPANAMATAGVLALQGAVNTLAPAFDKATTAVDAVAATITKAFDKLVTDGQSLQVDLLRAQGNNRGADFLAMGVDPTSAAASSVVAQYDANEAIRTQIKALTDQATATQAAADAAKAYADTLAATNKTWQDQLDVLTGAQTDRKIALRDAIDATTRTLMEQVYAQQDIKSAADASTQAAQKAADDAKARASAVLSERTNLQDQLDQLIMTEVQLRDKQRSALDASNQALFDQINAQNDLKTANDLAAQTALNAAEATKALAATNKGWKDQLDVLLGVQTDRTIALRDATDSSTRSLMEQVYAQQDLKTASDAAAQAAQKAIDDAKAKADAILSERKGLQDQYDQLTLSSTQLRTKERNALDATNQALYDQINAQKDLQAAAAKAVDSMKAVSDQIKQIATFQSGIGDAQQGIRSQMAGYDAVAYSTSQVAKYTGQMGAATDTTGRIDAGGKLQGAIVDKYNAELALIYKNRDAASSAAQQVFDAQTTATNNAISAQNTLNAAYRSIGEYAKGLITGANSPFSGQEQLSASGANYAQLLAGSRGGDVASLGKLTGAADSYLSQAKLQAVSSSDYARIFGRTVNDLSALGGRAGADLESVQRTFMFDSSAFDKQALELQTKTVGDLQTLSDLTDTWTADLKTALGEQALAYTNMGLTNDQIKTNTDAIGPGFEMVTAAITGAQEAHIAQQALLDEIKALRTEVAGLRKSSDATAANTGATAGILDSATGGGGPMLVEGTSSAGVLLL
jgi:phage-related minor tail protein